MNFREIPIKFSYESAEDDLVNDFYIPMLSNAKRYDRISGFFSSSSLAVAARGLAGLIEHNGTMRLITCPKLSKEDVEVINTSVDNIDEIFAQNFISDYSKIEDQFQKDHIAALGWMLANGYLEMKIALVLDQKGEIGDELVTISNSIMHQKVGILYDEDTNGVSFSGSNNETASGWLNNDEEFKVFKQWEPTQNNYFNDDVKKFEDYWNNQKSGVKVVDLPSAVSEKLIEISHDYSYERISLEKYNKRKITVKKEEKKEIKLFYYQNSALDLWRNNNNRLLFEMATGTGKTMTAIGCCNSLLSKESKPVLIVVACPQSTLSKQWKKQIEELKTKVDYSIICDGTNLSWHSEITMELQRLATGYYSNLVIYTTHRTCSSKDFVEAIQSANSNIVKLFVGDEVHGMGSNEYRKGLLDCYEYRIGLSATPSRWFDEEGSKLIEDYFGNRSFIFSIQEALKTINPATGKPFLVNYKYHPCFINLTDDELEDYKKLSEKISKMSRSNDEEIEKALTFLRFKRADIEKNAENKYAYLEKILDEVGDDLSDTIIFVDDEQIDRVMRMLGERGVIAHQFTDKQSPSPSKEFNGLSEREFLIKKFKEKEYQVLVAIKCLDEGIDIPSAKRAIIMASSTNPREYVQRTGRIIRQSVGKTEAELYDMIIHPDYSGFRDDDLGKLEKRIFEKEMVRVKELSENALNNSDVLNTIYNELGALL